MGRQIGFRHFTGFRLDHMPRRHGVRPRGERGLCLRSAAMPAHVAEFPIIGAGQQRIILNVYRLSLVL